MKATWHSGYESLPSLHTILFHKKFLCMQIQDVIRGFSIHGLTIPRLKPQGKLLDLVFPVENL